MENSGGNRTFLYCCLGAGVLVIVVCACVALAGGMGLWLYPTIRTISTPEILAEQNGSNTPTPRVVRPQNDPTQTPAQPGDVTPPAVDDTETPQGNPPTPVSNTLVFSETLQVLQDTIVPENNMADLAMRLQGIESIPEIVPNPNAPYSVGATRQFWATNTDTNQNFQVNATLRYVTPHLYFWVQDGINYDSRELRDLAETFENEIYPTNREFFGSEWTPGVDNDPHLYILLARGLGNRVAGYYSSADEVSPLAHEYSNAAEMFLLNADAVTLDDPFTYGVLAHEFQHMIHWRGDRNETSWLNEGFSDLAMLLNGYDVGGWDWAFAMEPDLQLNDWPNDPSATGPHYGASFMFVTYFLDRLGEEATKAVVSHDANGLESIDIVLDEMGATDSVTGAPITADDIFADWVITNYVKDDRVGDGRFDYSNFPNSPQTYSTEDINRCPTGSQTRDVNQYGADYIRITCPGEHTLYFEGSTQVSVVPEDAYSGRYAFWSNKGDESNMTLTQQFDLTGVSGPVSLSYWTWYDLETDYDYLYLEVSEDGERWEILITPSGTAEDPSGNSYGWGYNGLSGRNGQWIQEEVDISRYAGMNVWLRFEYVTDAAVNGEGFLLDDVEIAEIGYFADFETDEGGWEAAGFVRIQNLLPQTFRISVISIGRGTTVEYVTVTDDVTAEIPFSIGGDVNEVVVVVSGTTRFTRQRAAYRFEID